MICELQSSSDNDRSSGEWDALGQVRLRRRLPTLVQTQRFGSKK